jgi:hypothetical protein
MVKKQKNSSGDSTGRKPWVDPDDAPEITDEMLDRAVFRHGDTIIRRGRRSISDRVPRQSRVKHEAIYLPELSSIRND